ncbi:DNA polymerase III subunit gamma/tau [Novosphingobium sp. KCTC 2891]|uniref:DNA polymerase III subunit gamma/tau n=1 Tax=Novosphingobium sp. KCTC 2891 TaxID=2989730 RepID=UPI0022224774|nr:DNA polymerase III subunit gamma/tau [Novosphingobium sp. KCTC 2891]MCW1384711.1 DNA polymerase III subunit gamma/tau [Novosphingobium sp. KCTC 2891]
MAESTDMFGETPEDEDGPSAAELEAAGQSSMFGEPAPTAEPVAEAVPAPAPAPTPSPEIAAAPEPAAKAAPVQPYRVLARKYRPQTFSELIGQEAMVQTLGNAIRRDRLAHAFLMTGVRGVGKTSTARLIAKALNCIGPDGQGGPTIDPCGQCEPCVAIAEGRHIDVIEMDAASHTGVDDVREIIEAVRYAAVSARYKIYIIDEVHMLSRNAFNALLKTLEEPPAHVKFLFATTEVDKLPVTVLSRCQRFDLRRIQTKVLAAHFARVCGAEGVEAEDEALAMVAAAAEGSVRDGLSILDQAISHADMAGGDKVTAEQVREMLGLADKTMQRRLFASVLGGEGSALLEEVAHQYALGIEPIAMMRAQMDLVHRVTVAQVAGAADARSAEERAALDEWAKALAPGQLHRLWQLLLKGHDEVKGAPDPLVAAQMALLRVLHASEMPDPSGLVRKLEEIAARPVTVVAAAESAGGDGPAMLAAPMMPAAAPAPIAPDWEALVEQVENMSPLTGSSMRLSVRVIELKPGHLRYEQAPGLPGDPSQDIRKALQAVTGEAWQVERVAAGDGVTALPSLVEVKELREKQAEAEMMDDPLVKAAFAAFPGARIVDEDSSSEHSNRPWSRRA